MCVAGQRTQVAAGLVLGWWPGLHLLAAGTPAEGLWLAYKQLVAQKIWAGQAARGGAIRATPLAGNAPMT